MFRKIIRFKCSTNIYCVSLVLQPYGRETHPRYIEKIYMYKFRVAHTSKNRTSLVLQEYALREMDATWFNQEKVSWKMLVRSTKKSGSYS